MTEYIYQPKIYTRQDRDRRDVTIDVPPHPATLNVYRYTQIHGASGKMGLSRFSFNNRFEYENGGYSHYYTTGYRFEIRINDPNAWPPEERVKHIVLDSTTETEIFYEPDVFSLNPLHVLKKTPVTVQLVLVQINRNDYCYVSQEGSDCGVEIEERAVLSTGVQTLDPNIPQTPYADFWATPWEGDTPLSVFFDNRTIAEVVDQWDWDFGDGATSHEQHPFHTYTEPGIYHARLTATNRGGTDSIMGAIEAYEPCRDPYGKLNSVTCFGYDKYRCVKGNWVPIVIDSPECGYPSPEASFEASTYRGAAPLTVRFTDTSQPEPVSWFWDFGDGTTSTLKNPTHTYTKPGLWIVTLRATNQSGTGITTRIIDVVESMSEPSEPPQEQPVPCINPDGIPGEYTCIGTAWSKCINGEWTTINRFSAQCGAVEPQAAFSASPVAGTAPLTVAFTDLSSGSPISWAWTFGDGSTSTEQNPTHTYTTPGTYRVKLTVANGMGADSATLDIVVVESEETTGGEYGLLSNRKVQMILAGGLLVIFAGLVLQR